MIHETTRNLTNKTGLLREFRGSFGGAEPQLIKTRDLPGSALSPANGCAIIEPLFYSKEMSSSSMVLETERLVLRRLSTHDAEFVLELLNEPSFLRYIGDKGVRDLDDARQYILSGPVASYERNGFGLYLVELKRSRIPIGISGLVKRETLPDADIGFAFLPAYWSQGYAAESAVAVMKYAQETLKLDRILAITSPDNDASAKLLGKIGLRFERLIKLSEDAQQVKLFTTDV